MVEVISMGPGGLENEEGNIVLLVVPQLQTRTDCVRRNTEDGGRPCL
jgi:hypothetical protein